MSWDVWLEADLGGEEPTQIDTNWNYTSNMYQCLIDVGAYPRDFNGKLASECIPPLESAIDRIAQEPHNFAAKYDAANGWGSIETLLPALRQLLILFESAPNATVVCC